jgi:hypothetical protein
MTGQIRDQGTITEYQPTLRDRAAGFVADGLEAVGYDDRHAARVADRATQLLDWTPLGNAFGLEEGASDVSRGLRTGDLATAGLGAATFAASVLPFGGEVRKGVKAGENALALMFRDESGAIRAWHGSPRDFDKFDASKIGTGEGNQAFGDGLYFADRRGVASSYVVPRGVQPLPVPPETLSALRDPLKADGYLGYDSLGEAVNAARQSGDRLAEDYGLSPEVAAQIQAALNDYDAARWPEGYRPTLYETEINAEPHQFMDLPRGQAAPSPEVAKKQGFVGFRYKDGTTNPSSNYVVFDPSLVSILKKH